MFKIYTNVFEIEILNNSRNVIQSLYLLTFFKWIFDLGLNLVLTLTCMRYEFGPYVSWIGLGLDLGSNLYHLWFSSLINIIL